MYTDAGSVEEQTAEFLKDALYTHARQVDSFCKSSYDRIVNCSKISRSRRINEFTSKGKYLVAQFESLVDAARKAPPLASKLNIEQMEAKVGKLYDDLDHYIKLLAA